MAPWFTTPTQVSNELLTFLGLPENTLLSRTDIIRKAMDYCKEHSLMDGPKIKPDAALTKLLNLKEDDNLTILNLQKYLKRLTPKKPEPQPPIIALSAKQSRPRRFTSPRQVTTELLTFLNLPPNTCVSVMEATRDVLNYCKNKNLIVGEQLIVPNDSIAELLNLTENDEQVTIFNIQSYLKQHFIEPATKTSDTTRVLTYGYDLAPHALVVILSLIVFFVRAYSLFMHTVSVEASPSNQQAIH